MCAGRTSGASRSARRISPRTGPAIDRILTLSINRLVENFLTRAALPAHGECVYRPRAGRGPRMALPNQRDQKERHAPLREWLGSKLLDARDIWVSEIGGPAYNGYSHEILMFETVLIRDE